MPSRSVLRAFLALWIVSGVVILLASALTVRAALPGAREANPHVALLGAAEAVAALLFLVPRTLRLGAAGLLATIGIAFVLHAMLGQFRGDLLVYAAAVLFVAVHRPLSAAQWRAAISREA